jgi:hypothetical protein
VDLFVLDDAVQKDPDRVGMGPLTAVGGIHVPGDAVGSLERALENLCREAGFPENTDEFKWSPGRELWMHKNLRGPARTSFFCEILGLTKQHAVEALVVVVDEQYRSATGPGTPPLDDALIMCLERAHGHMDARATEALLIVDRPSGDRRAETKFLAQCLATMRAGTRFAALSRLSLVVATQSRLVRLLQVADLVTSSTLACVAGEAKYAPEVFEAVRPLLRGGGGVGLKIHPDLKYRNLYYWLLDEEYYTSRMRFSKLPSPETPYATSPYVV